MLKELIEDVKRYRADREVNSRSVECFDNATKNYVAKAWRHVKVHLHDDADSFRAHMVLK